METESKGFLVGRGRDQNSKFFHAYAYARRKSNEIRQLRSEEGELETNKERMSKIIVDYFRNIFSEVNQDRSGVEDNDGACVTYEQNATLVANITPEEFTTVIKQMHPDTASGPDGLNPAFFSIFGQIWAEKCSKVVKVGCKSVVFQLY